MKILKVLVLVFAAVYFGETSSLDEENDPEKRGGKRNLGALDFLIKNI